jgi:hypothetical protein
MMLPQTNLVARSTNMLPRLSEMRPCAYWTVLILNLRAKEGVLALIGDVYAPLLRMPRLTGLLG